MRNCCTIYHKGGPALKAGGFLVIMQTPRETHRNASAPQHITRRDPPKAGGFLVIMQTLREAHRNASAPKQNTRRDPPLRREDTL